MFRILVVDDSSDICDVLRAGIEEFGDATVECCTSGTTALEVIERGDLDAAVLDVNLPQISGFELAERATNLNIPVLLVPGHPTVAQVCEQYGFPYLPKPFSLDTLAAELVGIIQSSSKNIARVKASTESLNATAASLAEAVTQARRSAETASLALGSRRACYALS